MFAREKTQRVPKMGNEDRLNIQALIAVVDITILLFSKAALVSCEALYK